MYHMRTPRSHDLAVMKFSILHWDSVKNSVWRLLFQPMSTEPAVPTGQRYKLTSTVKIMEQSNILKGQ